MTRITRASLSSSKPTVAWGSQASVSVIEAPEREAGWVVFSPPHTPPAEGTSVDDLIEEFALEGVDVAHARKELAGLLADAGELSIRSLRLRAGLSQRQLGEKIGVSQPNVARLERRPGDIGLKTLRRLAEALGVDLNTLSKAIP